MNVTTDIKEKFIANKIFWTVLIVTVIGMAISGLGILNLLNQGLASTGMTDFVPMGIWLVLYIFFTGLSAGSFIMSTLAYVFNIERFKPIGRRAVALALILLINAPIFLAFDLGRPERVLNLLLYWNLTSVLAWGSRLLIIYPVICLLYLWALTFVDLVEMAKKSTGLQGKFYNILSLGKTEISEEETEKAKKYARFLGLIGIPTALATHGYTGFLFSAIGAHRLWNTPMMPVLFLSSAIISGAALLTVLVMLTDYFTKSKDTLPTEDWANFLVTFLFVDAILLFAEFTTVYLANVEEHLITWNVLLSGQYWGLFWIVELLIGFWIPMVLLLVPRLRTNKIAVFISSIFILLGVFAKRINLIIGGQLTTSLTGEVTTYTPSLTEYFITLGGVAAVAFFFIVAWKVLPLMRKDALIQEVSK
ncbi:MAG: NrfD/PsrC family molybdoenzyme membrane anchor subunit [Candidatus Hodarchaeales archaeon]|jgi:molybdopterin-containing oxidoreductase family membrane subunit